MNDSDDEDVIFQGSPLYDSLVSTGSLAQNLNIEVLDRDGTGGGKYEYQSSAIHTYKTGLEPKSLSAKQRVGSIWAGILAWLGIISQHEMVRRKDVEIVTSLLQSSTLDEDDSDFLHSYLEIPKVPAKPGLVKRSAVGLLLFMMPVVCALCLHSLFTATPKLNWSVLLLTVAIATLTMATLPLSVLYLGHVTDWQGLRKGFCGEEAKVKQFVKTGERFLAGLKRSLRFIQETELIARGFTLVSQKNPVSRLEAGSGGTRQCPGLRKLVFLVAREAIYSNRELTQQLINLETSGLVTDMKSSYLAFEPIQSYGPCLQLEHDGASEELYTITDGFSIYALKGICHLLQLHQSEFLKALTLTYSHSFKRPDTTALQPKVSTGLLELLQPASYQLQAWTDTIQESYTFHSCSLLSRQPGRPISKPSSQVEEVYTAIHSLDLHLQSALTRVRTFSSILEAKINEGDLASSGFQGDDPVNDIMQPIRSEIESCKCCWEEGVTRLEKMLGRQKPHAKTEGDPGQADQGEDLQETGQAKKIEDYIIEDQVFEAYTDPSEACLDDDDWEQPLTAEEKEKKKREKQEALRLLTELKSVISVRAVDREKREQAALLRDHPELASKVKPETAANQSADTKDEKSSTETSMNQPADLSDRKSSCKAEPLNQSSQAAGSPSQPDVKDMRNQSCDFAERAIEIDLGSRITGISRDTDIKQDLDKTTSQKDSDSNHALTETLASSIEDDDNVNLRKPLSIVTSQGVRRLRKSNMLDLSDSDSDYGEDNNTGHAEEYGQADEQDEHLDLGTEKQRCGLPPLPFFNTKPQVCETGSDSEDEHESTENADEYTEKPPLTLEERLRQFSGANLMASSSLAAEAVARSRVMGGMEEATFGGEVFGELSSSEEEKDDHSYS